MKRTVTVDREGVHVIFPSDYLPFEVVSWSRLGDLFPEAAALWDPQVAELEDWAPIFRVHGDEPMWVFAAHPQCRNHVLGLHGMPCLCRAWTSPPGRAGEWLRWYWAGHDALLGGAEYRVAPISEPEPTSLDQSVLDQSVLNELRRWRP